MMIEKTIISYFNQKNREGVIPKAYMMRQEEAPKQYILIEKTGSQKRNHITTSTLAFQSYAPTLLEAAQLNEQVKETVESMIELDDIVSVNLNSDYNFTNTADKQPRYQAVFNVTHY